ncbi:hypothetical protein LR48_Vigan08g066000 [Vigna angularis]|uniref:Uncharacterized protein n=1 Tax=Phaseolus angularis TaxID=3914 RepID=A0A0L9V482_PHAAN|nr:hypothetical protein LR48_Vigan08g066000 [Vigna angularis]
MQSELGLHVIKERTTKGRKLTGSNLKLVQFKMKLELPEALLRFLNDDRRRGKVGSGCIFTRSDRVLQKREKKVRAESGAFSENFSFASPAERTSTLQSTPTSHYRFPTPLGRTPGVR